MLTREDVLKAEAEIASEGYYPSQARIARKLGCCKDTVALLKRSAGIVTACPKSHKVANDIRPEVHRMALEGVHYKLIHKHFMEKGIKVSRDTCRRIALEVVPSGWGGRMDAEQIERLDRRLLAHIVAEHEAGNNPSWDSLCRAMSVSKGVLNRALARLRDCGAVGSRGTHRYVPMGEYRRTPITPEEDQITPEWIEYMKNQIKAEHFKKKREESPPIKKTRWG